MFFSCPHCFQSSGFAPFTTENFVRELEILSKKAFLAISDSFEQRLGSSLVHFSFDISPARQQQGSNSSVGSGQNAFPLSS